MANRPPREGARWGADPIVENNLPAAPSKYDGLCATYGKANVDRAVEIFNKIKTEFPHLRSQILVNGELVFAAYVLERATYAMRQAADDGRVHNLPNTLNILDKSLGRFLAKSPTDDQIRVLKIEYGDESRGNAARLAKSNSDLKFGLALISISVLAGIFTYIKYDNAILACIAAVALFFIGAKISTYR